MLQAAIDKSQEFVSGRVPTQALQGNVGVVAREEQIFTLRSGPGHVRGRQGRYDQRDAEGFIRLNALR